MPIKTTVYNQKAEKVEEISLPEAVFGVKANSDLIHQALDAYLSAQRQVLAHTKDRSEVRGGGKKPWKQKGTGRARAGSSRSPLWIGGGVTFGPTKNRNFSKKINIKMRKKALLMALSDKIKNESLLVVDKLEAADFKTKVFNEVLAGLEKIVAKEDKNKARRSVLIINDKKDEKTKRSAKNLDGVRFINLSNINIFDLLKYKNLIITKEGIKKLEQIYK